MTMILTDLRIEWIPDARGERGQIVISGLKEGDGIERCHFPSGFGIWDETNNVGYGAASPEDAHLLLRFGEAVD